MIITFVDKPQVDTILKHMNLDQLIRKMEGTLSYHGNGETFNTEQRRIVYDIFSHLSRILIPYDFEIGHIKLILLRSGCYWDYPFTLGMDMIIITESLFYKKKDKLKEIFLHELIHLDQRRDPEKYEQYYRSLGFAKYNIKWGILTNDLLNNPDGVQYEWIWKSPASDILYLPCAVLDKGKVITLIVMVRDYETINYDITKSFKIVPIEQAPLYHGRFGTTRQLYHPNELTAHLITDWIIKDLKYHQIDYVDLRDLLTR